MGNQDVPGLESEERKKMQALIEIVTSERTPDPSRIQALNRLIDIQKQNTDYFDIIIDSDLDYGMCPCCGHYDHWLTPVIELATRGIIPSELDDRVKDQTTAEDCPTYKEACAKKKVTI